MKNWAYVKFECHLKPVKIIWIVKKKEYGWSVLLHETCPIWKCSKVRR